MFKVCSLCAHYMRDTFSNEIEKSYDAISGTTFKIRTTRHTSELQ